MDGIDDRVERFVLADAGDHSGLEQRFDLTLAGGCGEHDDRDLRSLLADAAGDLDAVVPGQPVVDDHHVGRVLFAELDTIEASDLNLGRAELDATSVERMTLAEAEEYLVRKALERTPVSTCARL